MKILQTIIKHARKKQKELNFVMIDLAKAFDTVSHDSIIKALRNRKIPEIVISAIMDMYKDATTTITNGKAVTIPINIRAGVKQGCPLSPFLFNLIMDELLERLQRSNLGCKVDDEHIATMAFADDLILLSDNNYHMEKLMQITEQFFDEKSLAVNVKKCVSYRQVPTSKKTTKKNVKVITDKHRKWKGNLLPSMTYEDLPKYLGVKFTPRGDIAIPWTQWDEWLENLRKAPLKPEQKVFGLKNTVIPKMLHQLRLANTGITKLKLLNTKIKKWFKKVMHLPEWTPDAWVNGKFGGALQDILKLVLSCRKKASTNMSNSTDKIAATVGAQEDLHNEANLARLGTEHLSNAAMKTHWERMREEQWSNVTNGRALTTMTKSVVKRDWLWHAKKIPSKKRIRCLQFLSGTLPTRLNENRGRNTENKEIRRCRKCKKTTETDLHVLNECSATKDMRTKRHNKVCDVIAKQVCKDDWRKVREKRWRVEIPEGEAVAGDTGQRHVQPDISVERDGQLTWIEVTCPYEKSLETLATRENEKYKKYSWIKPEYLNCNINEIQLHTVAIGSCGTISKATMQKLKKIGVNQSGAKKIQLTVMLNSADIVNTHMSHDDASRH